MAVDTNTTSSVSDLKPLMRDLHVDDEPEITETESLCMNCHENGISRLLLTKIPFFRDVIVSSFRCDKCSWSNTDLMPVGEYQDTGIRITLKVTKPEDYNRQLVVMQAATITVPEVTLEIPPSKGSLTTVEGIIMRTADDLQFSQPVRKVVDPETAEKIEQYIKRLRKLQETQDPFTLIIDDPTGNSFVENPYAPKKDENLTIVNYKRSAEEDERLGLTPAIGPHANNPNENREDTDEKISIHDEVMVFPSPCPNCKAMIDTKMKQVSIPHFKEVLIMATCCDHCGVRENEVKSGSGIEPLARKFCLEITDSIDMSRDVLKSDNCAVSIPELEFESLFGGVTSKFTTVEGLLGDIKDQVQSSNPFLMGDSAEQGLRNRVQEFCDKIDQIIAGERMGVHLVLDDPTGNSYLQNIYVPDADPHMEMIDYERTWQQNEELGLNDMMVD